LSVPKAGRLARVGDWLAARYAFGLRYCRDPRIRLAQKLVPKSAVPAGLRCGAWHTTRRDELTWLSRDAEGEEPERWMDDSLSERIGLLPLVERARGHVHISGLGLGLAVGAVLRRPAVTKVTVVERSPEIVRMVGPYACQDPRVELLVADAYEWKPPPDSCPDVCWHDVWATIEEAVERAAPLLELWQGRCEWQGYWGAREFLELRR
jgi:hypothetical protein